MTIAKSREILDRLVAFPTVSDDSNLSLIAYVETLLAEHGIESVRVPSDCGTKAALYAHTGPRIPGGVVLSGHTDVVPTTGQDWSTAPWTLTEIDGKLYGRGTCDMKGFVALALAAMIEASKLDLALPLQIALTYDEETGLYGAPPMLAHMAAQGFPKAEIALVGEPSMMKVVNGHKGGLGYKLDFRGFEIHSSLMHRGVNAIMWGAELIAWANRINAKAQAAEPTAMSAAFDPPWSSVHVGTISGGTAFNITAKECRFDLDIRLMPDEPQSEWEALFEAERARLEDLMKAVRPEAAILADKDFAAPGLKPEPQGRAEALARQLSGYNDTEVVSFMTEGGLFQEAGYSTVVCGPGSIEQAHQPNEFISLTQLEEGWRFQERLLKALINGTI